MLGAVKMENGLHNGVRSNHDRDAKVNGVTPGMVKPEPEPEKGKAAADGRAGGTPLINGGYDDAMDIYNGPQKPSSATAASPVPNRMHELPEEIKHITTDIMPLSLLLTRLAQISHNQIQDLVRELATKAVPQAAMNGNTDFRSTTAEDTSPDSLEKKQLILNHIQDMHSKWVKALVITEWSKKAEAVGKLIDIKSHLHEQLNVYETIMWELAGVKRDLIYARLPSPDLKTALQILATGEVSWMPELGYIEPPPVSPEDQLKWMDNLNTLLSVRLSLDDHEKIPQQFRSYSIGSGRVTFKVEGEFEVDLTMADEDFEKQFWFIDFRFVCRPAPSEISDSLRLFLESKVNDALGADGLEGCYHFLHEFVLTHKISEFRRQAIELSRGRWVETLKVERLNRAMSIQYWTKRYPPSGPKSWVILGVHSGRRPNMPKDEKATSRLTLRWFRDNKEVKDVDIPFNVTDISAETLLKMVIARHTEHILSTLHHKLEVKPRFTKQEAALRLEISRDEPMRSALQMQLTHDEFITAKIDPITGFFSMSPHSGLIMRGEAGLNQSGRDPAEEGLGALESIRCVYVMEELNRRGKSLGWMIIRAPIRVDELKPVVNSREAFQTVWLKRLGWSSQWYIMLSLSLAGDRWWLMDVPDGGQPSARIKSYTQLPFTSGQPQLSSSFFDKLTMFTTAMIAQISDLRELHARRVKHVARLLPNPSLPPQIKLPTIFLRLSEVLPLQAGRRGSRRQWAADFVRLTFKGLRKAAATGQDDKNDNRLSVVAEGRLAVSDRSKFSLLKGNVDNDVLFSPKLGQFALRLETEVGKSVLDSLGARLRAIDRLVDFVDAIRRRGSGLVCQSVTLRQVVFDYGDAAGTESPAVSKAVTASAPAPAPASGGRRWKVVLDLAQGEKVNITLEKGNPHLRALDMLKTLANSPVGFDLLPSTLTLTLPLFRAIDRLEDSWDKAAMNDLGSIEIHLRALEYLHIRYNLSSPPQPARQLELSVRLSRRRGDSYWHVARANPDANRPPPADDAYQKALKKIWDGQGTGTTPEWKGLGTGAAANPATGIESLLSTIDDAVKVLLSSPGQQQQPAGAAGAAAASAVQQKAKAAAAAAAKAHAKEVVVLD